MKRARARGKREESKFRNVKRAQRKEEIPFVSEQEDKLKKVKKSSKKRKENRKKRIRFFLILILLAIVIFFLAMGMGTSEDNSLIPVDESTGKINVLLVGVDDDGLRTDAIMLASYNFDEESLKLMSIPRDTKVYVTNRRITRKINEVHAMTNGDGKIFGPLASVEAVSQLTGIPINYYVEFSFDAIDHIMDILGPVEYDVPDVEGRGRGMNYDDPVQDLHIHLKPGLQKLSGNQVQQFLRYRKSNNNSGDGSDTSRVQRQQDFVKAVLQQKVNLSLVIKAPYILNELKKEIKTNFSSGEVGRYATHLLKLKAENIKTFSLPGEDKLSGAWYFVCDTEKTRELVKNEFGYDVTTLSHKIEITGDGIVEFDKSSPVEEEEPEPTVAPEEEEEIVENRDSTGPEEVERPEEDNKEENEDEEVIILD